MFEASVLAHLPSSLLGGADFVLTVAGQYGTGLKNAFLLGRICCLEAGGCCCCCCYNC